MGLSTFEESPSPTSYCSISNDRSLTTRLIESSNSPFKSTYRFAHTPEWADGLDTWSSASLVTKTDISRRHCDFHRDLGLYLPRHEKPNSAPISLKTLQMNSKIATNHFTPERIQHLLRREKDLLERNLSDERVIIENSSLISTLSSVSAPPPVPVNTFRQSLSIEIPVTNEIRLPLRHAKSKPLSPPQQQEQQQKQTTAINQDALKSLLKEHLTSLLTRGAATINANRSFINAPSVDIRQNIRTDSKLAEERYRKIDEITPIQQIKTNQTSPVVFYPKPTFGLTVTPVDLNSQRNFQSVSLEKMAQQRNCVQDNDSSSVASSRPSTQPVPVSSPSLQFSQPQQTQKVLFRRNIEISNSLAGDINMSNENQIKSTEQNQPFQNNRKVASQNRASSKSTALRIPAPTTIELLPPIISGKRLHIPIANHRYL